MNVALEEKLWITSKERREEFVPVSCVLYEHHRWRECWRESTSSLDKYCVCRPEKQGRSIHNVVEKEKNSLRIDTGATAIMLLGKYVQNVQNETAGSVLKDHKKPARITKNI